MAFNTSAVATQLVTVLSGLTGMGAAQIGAPESVGKRVHAYVTMGSQTPVRKTTERVDREARYMVMFAYRVDNAETTAETTLMGLVDDFMQALFADLTLNGTVDSLEVSSLAADEPNYQLRAGKEYREYPVIVSVMQRDAYEVNP